MSVAPRWLDEVMAEFGRSAGLDGLALGERGTAALRGDNGTTLAFEYVYPRLTVMMTAPVRKDAETARRVLAMAEPSRRGRYRVRAGLMPRDDRAFFAAVLDQEAVTLPALNAVFGELRRLADRLAAAGGEA